MSQVPACDYCRRRKRKCDRATPKCSMCMMNSQECRYTEQMRWAYQEPALALDLKSDPGQTDRFFKTPMPDFSDFPSVYFLDHDIFDQSGIKLPTVHLHLHPRVLEAFNTVSAISARFFSWIHLWMPIISKSRWKRVTGPLARPTTDVKLLLFSMMVLLWAPPQEPLSRDPRHEDYLILKSHLSEAENAGLLTLDLLQAWVLKTIYEYAHTIYPAAYISVGTCFRYSLALGIDKQRQFEIDATGEDPETQEEKRRVWWSVIILDRMISQSSSGPEPRSDDLLPVPDEAWDDGNIEASRICPVSAPSSTDMGMLARLAQSAFLLGRVYRWKDHPTGDAQFDRAEKLQLDRALRALVNLIYEEGATRLMPICPQTTLCFSAMVILHSQDAPSSSNAPSKNIMLTTDFSQQMITQNDSVLAAIQTLQLLRPIAQESLISTNLFFRGQPWSIERSSPLLLQWTYLIAVTFMKIARCLEGTDGPVNFNTDLFRNQAAVELREARHGLNVMKIKLALLGKQWVAADAYLKILEAREVGDMG